MPTIHYLRVISCDHDSVKRAMKNIDKGTEVAKVTSEGIHIKQPINILPKMTNSTITDAIFRGA